MIPTKLTVVIFLLICLNSCKGQTQSNTSIKKVDLRNSTNQIDSSKNTLGDLDKNIRSVYQDRNGNFWFGTNGAGVYRYDSITLTQYTVKDGLANNQVLSIQEDDLGNIWFGTGGFGISKFDGAKITMNSDNVNITKGEVIDWKSKSNDLWFCAGGGVLRYSNPSIDYLPFDQSSSSQPKNPFSLSRFGVYCIIKDKNGNVWFGTQAEGVCRFDGNTLIWFKEKGLAGPAVLGLFEDSRGNIWFGNNGSGLFRYDGKIIRNITEEQGLGNPDFMVSGASGLGTMARVYSINEDNNGNIWIGTVDAGVWKFDGRNLTNYTIKDGLTSNAINTIYKDNNGDLWFGTDSHGICKFNGTTFNEFILE